MVAAAGVAVGIIPATTRRALEDAAGAVEVALERAAVAVAVDGKTVGVAIGSTDGRRMVDGVGAGAGLLQVQGRPYDETHQDTGGDAIIFFLYCVILAVRV